jgi:hypothetical protein
MQYAYSKKVGSVISAQSVIFLFYCGNVTMSTVYVTWCNQCTHNMHSLIHSFIACTAKGLQQLCTL